MVYLPPLVYWQVGTPFLKEKTQALQFSLELLALLVAPLVYLQHVDLLVSMPQVFAKLQKLI
jgi:hypothetical protein